MTERMADMAERVSSYDRDARTPEVGSEWVWAADKAPFTLLNPMGAREQVRVVEVKWNGEEWWIRSAGPRGVFWNDLSVFWESVTPSS